jgi:stress responsive alpha/beta barrel protein
MLRHIVMVTFKADATDAERAAVRTAVEGFADKCPDVRSLVCGDNVGSGPNHHDFAMVADFDDMAAFRRYTQCQAHKDYVAGPARAIERLSAIQHDWT